MTVGGYGALHSARSRRSVSAIGKSPLSQTLAEACPRGARRQATASHGCISLDDMRFSLLAIGQPAPSALSLGPDDLLRVHSVDLPGGSHADPPRRPSTCCAPTAMSASPAAASTRTA